jgi:hypothetical protein
LYGWEGGKIVHLLDADKFWELRYHSPNFIGTVYEMVISKWKCG